MRAVLENGEQEAFIVEDAGGGFYIFDRRALRAYGPTALARLTRHDRWRPFRGDEALVLEYFGKAERLPLK